jgi:hypothetical protein
MGNGLSDSSGLRIVEEESMVDVVRREHFQAQEQKVRTLRDTSHFGADTPEDIKR